MPKVKLLSILTLVILLTLLTASVGSAVPILTGDALQDFTGVNVIDVLDPGGQDVGTSSIGGGLSGWDVRAVYFDYDSTSDTMYVGIDCFVICGDADGDGDPGRTGAALGAKGGTDRPDLAGTESFAMILDTNNDYVYNPNGTFTGNFEVAVGKSSDAGSDLSSFGTYYFAGDPYSPSSNFGAPVPGVSTLLAFNPSAAHPDLEFAVVNFSKLPGFAFNPDGTFGFKMNLFSGSLEDDGVGEDFTPGQAQTITIVPPRLFGDISIGDTVFYDTNGNGVQETGEPPISGVQMVITSDPANLRSTTTGSNPALPRKYAFTDLEPDTYYTVEVADTNFAPGGPLDGLVATTDWDGDGRGDRMKMVRVGTSNNWDYDFGFVSQPVCETLQPGPGTGQDTYIRQEKKDESNGNRTELRTDSDKGKPVRSLVKFDLSSLPPSATIESATLSLYLFGTKGSLKDAVEAHRMTRAWAPGINGNNKGASWNRYDGLASWATPGGDYDSAIAGSFAADGLGWKSMDLTALAQAWAAGTYPNYGVAFLSPAAGGNNEKKYYSSEYSVAAKRPKLEVCYRANLPAVGDFVWEDFNKNGLQDAGEPPLDGVIVELFNGLGTKIDEATTDLNGLYQFSNLLPGSYYLKFTPKPGYSITDKNKGNDTKDSDADPATGETGNFQLHMGENDMTRDAGMYSTLPGTIGDYVWLDANGDGIQDDPDTSGINGVVVQLLDMDGNVVQTTTTAGVSGPGYFQFANVTPGLYVVKIADGNFATGGPLKGTESTSKNQGIDRALDSNGNPGTHASDPIAVRGGEARLDVDFGFIRGEELCVVGYTGGPLATMYVTVDGNGDVTARLAQSRKLNDNSYGANAIGWPGGHKFGDLTGSDQVTFQFKDRNGNAVLTFKLDYLTAKSGTPSGYASLGPDGGDGGMISGTRAWILGWDTSIAHNLNNTGYCSGGNCTVNGVNLLVDSPPADANYNVANPIFALWDFTDWSEVKVSHLAFGTAGFGSVAIVDAHDSPKKLSVDTTKFGLCEPPGGGCPPEGVSSKISSAFNGTAIAAGSTIWFNGVVKVGGMSSGGTLTLQNGKIAFSVGGTAYNLDVPDNVIAFSPTATAATQTFNTSTGAWETTVPAGYSGNVSLGGASFIVPAGGFPGGVKPVVWSFNFATDKPGTSISWKWAAAVYSTFSPDYNALGVKPVDGDKLSAYHNSDHAGVTENYKAYVKGGARGGGGSNWTGSYSGTAGAKPCEQGGTAAGFTCSRPIDSITMIWNGTNPILVDAWYGGIGSVLLANDAGVGSGDELTVSGYAGSPNDVIWEIYDAATGLKLGKSTFHLSCSDDDMDGPEDCGKAEGDGKGLTGYMNNWLLEGMVDSDQSFNCTP